MPSSIALTCRMILLFARHLSGRIAKRIRSGVAGKSRATAPDVRVADLIASFMPVQIDVASSKDSYPAPLKKDRRFPPRHALEYLPRPFPFFHADARHYEATLTASQPTPDKFRCNWRPPSIAEAPRLG
jgi:hypothetical protein